VMQPWSVGWQRTRGLDLSSLRLYSPDTEQPVLCYTHEKLSNAKKLSNFE
jgi:hypothetical protein